MRSSEIKIFVLFKKMPSLLQHLVEKTIKKPIKAKESRRRLSVEARQLKYNVLQTMRLQNPGMFQSKKFRLA